MEDRGSNLAIAIVDGIPVLWMQPDSKEAPKLALWIPPLSRTKEMVVPFLRDLARVGFLAISFDPWQHGERGTESGEQILERIFGDFRRHMWPILGQTTLDSLRVIDWAMNEFQTAPEVVAGGVSMGGDIAVALAGIDRRITRVATIVSTPDWTRPGMHDFKDPSRLLPQGQADEYAQWFYTNLDPLTHLGAYAHGPAIAFECGEEDTHVLADGALRFQAALNETYPQFAERICVAVHHGLGHLDGAQSPKLARNCLAWLLDKQHLSEII